MRRANIYIHGQIGYDWWSGIDNTAQRFIGELNGLLADDNVDEIDIHINSVGGDVHEGLAIYNAIKASKKPTTAIIDGVAYSMGAIIALAANNTHIAANGLFMLHNASGMSWGNAKSFRDTADTLDKYDNQLAVSVASKTGMDLQEIKDLWFNYEDNFFTAQEAKDAKLVDLVLDDEADLPDGFEANAPTLKVAAQLSKHFAPKQQSWFNKLVTRVRDELTIDKIENNLTPNNNEDTMIIKNSWNALLAAFGLEPSESDAVNNVTPNEAQLEAINNKLALVDNLQATNSDLNQQVSDITAERDALQAEVARLGALAGHNPTPPSGNVDPIPGEKPKNSWDIEREQMLARRKK